MGTVNACTDYRREGPVAVITIENPPVNALKAEVRAGLEEALKRASADTEAKAVVLTGGGKMFSAGADITEFNKPLQKPGLNDLIAQIEAMPKPVVAALHVNALAGGLELALACHWRVASPGTKIGLPEVKI